MAQAQTSARRCGPRDLIWSTCEAWTGGVSLCILHGLRWIRIFLGAFFVVHGIFYGSMHDQIASEARDHDLGPDLMAW